jgi:hypothetical protein
MSMRAAGTLALALACGAATAAVQLPSVDVENTGGSELVFNIKDGLSSSYTLDLGIVLGAFDPTQPLTVNLAADPTFATNFLPGIGGASVAWGVTAADNVFAGTGLAGDPSYGTRVLTTSSTRTIAPLNINVLNDANGWAIYTAALNLLPSHDDALVANHGSSFTDQPTGDANYNNMGNDLGGGFAANGAVGQPLFFALARQTSQPGPRPGSVVAGEGLDPAILGFFVGHWDLTPGGVLRWLPGRANPDFEGNVKADILWRNSTSGAHVVWLMDGRTVTGSGQVALFAPATGLQVAGLDDFDGDGRTDILWRNANTGANTLWLMDGTTRLASPAVTARPTIWRVAGTGDFDADGKADIFWRSSAGANVVWLMNGAAIRSQRILPSLSDAGWDVAALDDFEGDGRSDVLWRNSVTGANLLWRMNGVTIAARLTVPAMAARFQLAGTGHFDADRKTDIVWRSSTGQNVLWRMDGATRLAAINLPSRAPGTEGWGIAQIEDYDGDGDADILWRSQTGLSSLWVMNRTVFVANQSLTRGLNAAWQVIAP